MPTITKSFPWNTSNEFTSRYGQFTPSFTSGIMTLGGQPASNDWIWSPTGVTWETWGVPSGATVTNIQCNSLQDKTDSLSGNFTYLTTKLYVVNSSNVMVHSAGYLVVANIAPSVSIWHGDPTYSRAVDSSYQASSTQVRMVFDITCVGGDWSLHNLKEYFTGLSFDIAYTGGNSPAKSRRSPYLYNRTGARQAQL